ncbi:hypothetical protein SETIT_8G044700v2 [Setaria italica]|uniref:Uncharacterized protein n=1 Tax=Setaria italica TaxID=4555 RepID=A0A368S462_SETIT|nr:hypothetical protein SETIT_8G044700v2 [Setaria italica]
MATDLILTKRRRPPPRSTCSPRPAARRGPPSRPALPTPPPAPRLPPLPAPVSPPPPSPRSTVCSAVTTSPASNFSFALSCLSAARAPLLGDGHDAWVLEVARRSVNLRQSMNTGESSLLMHPMPTE